MVMTTTKPKLIAVFLGSLSGGLITATLAGVDLWTFVYMDPDSGFLGPNSDWAWIAAIVGAVCGFLAGALLGLFLSLMRRGRIFGILVGAGEGMAIILIVVAPEMTTGDLRGDLMLATFIPIGAFSGFLTSLSVSAITAWANRDESR